MYRIVTLVRAGGIENIIPQDVRTELIRKSIHMLIALVPAFLELIGTSMTLALLAAGSLVYTYAEVLRASGARVFLISRVTVAAARDRDRDRMIMGPVTLALGAMLAVLLYPSPASVIAIYALAFGDSLSSIAGKLLGSVRLPLFPAKSVEGSLACFLAVYYSAVLPLNSPTKALVVASAATVFEALPLGDLDNIVLPVGTGLVVSLLLPV